MFHPYESLSKVMRGFTGKETERSDEKYSPAETDGGQEVSGCSCGCGRPCYPRYCCYGPTGPTAPSIYAQHGNCRNHAAFHYLKDN